MTQLLQTQMCLCRGEVKLGHWADVGIIQHSTTPQSALVCRTKCELQLHSLTGVDMRLRLVQLVSGVIIYQNEVKTISIMTAQ